ncbi:MAG: hypothetical protein M9894_22445 [Planctomycetes bacterium]|nr:hypothetical protein [Planctomycetota bacterium]
MSRLLSALTVLALTIAGCDRRSSPPALETAHPALESPAAISDVLSGAPEQRPALISWALDPEVPMELRVTALRQLEELGDPPLDVLEQLARPDQPTLVRQNAVAALVRRSTPEADAVIARLAPDEQALARLLAGGAR